MYEDPQKYCGAWNFGPNQESIITVGEIAEMIVAKWGSGSWIDKSDKSEPHEANLLSLDISKAKTYLKWSTVWDAETTIEKTVEWYRKYRRKNPYEICKSQINKYMNDARV